MGGDHRKDPRPHADHEEALTSDPKRSTFLAVTNLLSSQCPLSTAEVAMFRRARIIPIAAACVAVLALPAFARPTAAGSVPLPNSMASAGDSITQAYDVDWSCLLSDCPQDSWSTGTDTSVDGEYQRILAANSVISGHEYNDAAAGAKMAALDGQVKTAASHGVQYLTVEMGANDLCVSNVSDMTPTSTFQSEFHTALTDFTAADTGARIFVASIPNIYQLWQDEESNPIAELEWNVFGICPDMLRVTATTAQRQQIVTQEQADNRALAAVCTEFPQCKFDNDAVYDLRVTSSDVSDVDYFHPSIAGQNALAALAWSAGYWPGTK
jgi:lysophospholipase L1-like esterase